MICFPRLLHRQQHQQQHHHHHCSGGRLLIVLYCRLYIVDSQPAGACASQDHQQVPSSSTQGPPPPRVRPPIGGLYGPGSDRTNTLCHGNFRHSVCYLTPPGEMQAGTLTLGWTRGFFFSPSLPPTPSAEPVSKADGLSGMRDATTSWMCWYSSM